MAARKRVLIVGDSISIGYTPLVAELLAAEAETPHNPGNGGDSDNVLQNLPGWLAEASPDVVHLNCGLHDVKSHRDPPRIQVPLERYRDNLRRIVRRLADGGWAAVWANTTPVIEPRHTAVKEFDRFNRDVEAYNAAADAIVSDARLSINDLHAVVVSAGPETVIREDGVHMREEGSRMLARAVADCLRPFL